MAELSAVILAAGLSRRMGRNKLLLPYGRSTILGTVLDTCPFELFSQTVVIVSSEQTRTIAEHYPVQVVTNHQPECGKSTSIRLGLSATEPNCGLLFLVADQPLLQRQTINRLIAASRHYPECIICPISHGHRGNPTIFPARLRPMLAELTDDQGGKELCKRYPELVHSVEFADERQFFDIDTDQAYQEAIRLWHRP